MTQQNDAEDSLSQILQVTLTPLFENKNYYYSAALDTLKQRSQEMEMLPEENRKYLND